MTFPRPETINKYRDIDNKIAKKNLRDEEINKQNKNLSEMFDKNLNKYFNEKNDVSVGNILNINDSTDLIEVDKNESENLLKDVFEIDNNYKFITDDDILSSFNKVFKNYKVVYTPYKETKNLSVKYLLDKLYNNDKVPKELFSHFDSSLTNLRKNSRKIPVEYIDSGQVMINQQTGKGNIKIKDLDKGILRIRYSNNRKLTSHLLKELLMQ